MADITTAFQEPETAGLKGERYPASASASPRAGRLHPRPIAERLIAGDRRRGYLLLGIWLATALAVTTGTFVAQLATGRAPSWFGLAAVHCAYWLCWVLACPPMYLQLHRLLSGTVARWRAAVALLFVCVAASLSASVVTYLVAAVLREAVPTWPQFVGRFLTGSGGISFQAMNAGVFVTAVLGLMAVRNGRLRDVARFDAALAAIRGAELDSQLNEARLRALQSQVNPHFLFNALNNIATLVRTGESERAFDGIGQLGALLRAALRTTEETWSTLGDEVEFVEQYLALCELRMQSRLHWSCVVAESLRSQRVPALILQPLVENCVKHAVRGDADLTIEVHAWEADRCLSIEVTDDGIGIDPAVCADPPSGHGLRNVAERLRLMCGAVGALVIAPRLPRGTASRMTLPWEAA